MELKWSSHKCQLTYAFFAFIAFLGAAAAAFAAFFMLSTGERIRVQGMQMSLKTSFLEQDKAKRQKHHQKV